MILRRAWLSRRPKRYRCDVRGKIGAVGYCWGARYVINLFITQVSVLTIGSTSSQRWFAKDRSCSNVPRFLCEASGCWGDFHGPHSFDQGNSWRDVLLWVLWRRKSLSHMSIGYWWANEQIADKLRPRLGDKLLVKNVKDATHGFAVGHSDMSAQEKEWKEEAYVQYDHNANDWRPGKSAAWNFSEGGSKCRV